MEGIPDFFAKIMRCCAKSWDRQEKTILSYFFLGKRLYFVQLLVCSNEFVDYTDKDT